MLQDQLQKNGGLLGGLIGAVASVTTEQADDRMWRMLPGRVYVARGYLPPGTHQLSVNGRPLPEPVQIDGQYALVPMRLYHNTVLMGKVATIGSLAAVSAAPPTPVAATAAANEAPTKPQKAKKRRTSKPAAASAAQ